MISFKYIWRHLWRYFTSMVHTCSERCVHSGSVLITFKICTRDSDGLKLAQNWQDYFTENLQSQLTLWYKLFISLIIYSFCGANFIKRTVIQKFLEFELSFLLLAVCAGWLKVSSHFGNMLVVDSSVVVEVLVSMDWLLC